MELIRAFIAVELSEQVKKEIIRVVGILKKNGENIKWVRPENMHLTLKFLGNVKKDRIPEITRKMEEAAKGIKAFDIRVNGIGAFPDMLRARVLWAGIDNLGGKILELLAEKIDEKIILTENGTEKHVFKPHLTIGRVKHIKNRKGFGKAAADINIKPVSMGISCICLFSSRLTPSGPEYEKLSVVELV